MTELPRFDQLGSDPEPLGTRSERLLEQIEAEQSALRRNKGPRVCPLSQPIGRPSPCSRARCPYYRVPGTQSACAVEQWSPGARREPRIAAWFIARRDEILRGRAHPARVAPWREGEHVLE
jgi:hypothetical protein